MRIRMLHPPTQTQPNLERSAVLLFEVWLCRHKEVWGEAMDVSHHTVAFHGDPEHADHWGRAHPRSRHSC